MLIAKIVMARQHAAYHGKSDVIGLLFEYEADFEKNFRN
jgi:hypothetical protein